MNAKSNDVSPGSQDAVRHLDECDRIIVQPQQLDEQYPLYKHLTDVRARLLGLREAIEIKLVSRVIPNNIDAIENALAALDERNGRLELPMPISRLDLLLIWGAPQAKWITNIVFKGLETKFNPDDFRIPSERFLRLYGVDCPDGLLKTYDLFAKIDKFLGKGAELGFISFEQYGLSSYLFAENEPPANALILHKHGHHELNYVPYAAYGSDAVTYGLLYDYYRRSFLTTVYHGDGEVNAHDNPLKPFIKKFHSPLSSFPIELYGETNDAELIDRVTNVEFQYDWFDEFMHQLGLHTVACFLSAYFVENPTASQTIPMNDKGRYERCYAVWERKALQVQFPSSYLFDGTMPVTPIALDRFGGDQTKVIDDFVDFVVAIAELHGETHPRNEGYGLFDTVPQDAYKQLRASFREMSLPLLSKCGGLGEYVRATRVYRKRDRAVMFALLDGAVRKIESFAKRMIRNGAEGYGFVTAMILYDRCGRGRPSKVAARLLQSLSDAVCPEFIKKTAALHSVVRHDRYIPT